MGKSAMKVVGAILMVVGMILSFVPGFSQTLIMVGRAMMVIGSIMSAMAQSKPNVAMSMAKNGHLINTRSTSEAIPIVYGLMRVGGNQVFMTTTGGYNKYLHIVMTLSEGEIESVEEVYLDDKPISDDLFDGYAWWYFKSGTMDQTVFSELNADYPAFTDPMRGTALLYVKLKFHEKRFQGVPLITALIKGRKLFDPRDNSTAYSTNPALVCYDMMTARYGMARPAALINEQSVIDTANKCDTEGFTFNGRVDSPETAQDYLDLLLANMRGFCIWTGAEYKLGIYDFDASVMTLTENDIIEDSFEIALPGLPETPNKIKVKFIDPTQKYTVIDFDFQEQSVLTIEGSERTLELLLMGTTVYQQAVDLATYVYERARLNKTFTFVAGRNACSLEPGDIVLATHSLPGWNEQEIRILQADIQADQTVAIVAQLESSLLYDRKLNVTGHYLYSGTFYDPRQEPPTVGGVTLNEVVVASKDKTFSRLRVGFAVPDSIWWSHVDAYVSTDGVNYDFFVSAKEGFTIEPCEEGVTFYVKLQNVTIYDVKEDYDTLTVWSINIIGKQTLPSNVQNFSAIAVGDSVNFKWDEAVDFDIVGYEIRRGNSWAGAVKLALVQSSLSYLAVGVKPGEHTFYIKAKDSLGQYSATVASKTVTVLYSANYTDKHTWTTDFNEGTHSNTAYQDHGTYGRVLYVNSGLTGNWTSAVKDMGSAKDMRFWVNYLLELLGDETVWEGQYGTSDTWEKFGAGLSWAAIFEPSQAARITIDFMHSLDNSNWTTIPNFQIFSGEVNCRYVKYKIYIENVSENAYLYVKPSTLKAAYWA